MILRKLVAIAALLGMVAACSQQRFQRVQHVKAGQHRARSLRGAFHDLPQRAERTDIRILDDNMTAWTERWRLMDRAADRIDVVYFIVYRDIFGMAFMGRLVEKAREGKRVRILLDTHGTPDFTTGWMQRDYLEAIARAPNVELRLYNPWGAGIVNTLTTFDLQALIASNHDKILVVDNREGIIGGRNISHEYFATRRDDKRAMVDLDILLEGPQAARDMRAAFEREYGIAGLEHVRPDRIDVVDPTDELLFASRLMDLWLRSEPFSDDEIDRLNGSREARDAAQVHLENAFITSWGYRPAAGKLDKLRALASELVTHPSMRGALHSERPPVFNAPALILDTASTEGDAINQINESLVHLMRNTRNEIVIQNPYVIINERMLDVFKEVSEHGVKMTVLTNSPTSSDSTIAQALFNHRWPILLGDVPTLRIFAMEEPLLFHTKSFTFDERVTLLGSYNLDPLSYRINSEIVAVVWSEPFAKAISELAWRHVRRGRPHVIEYTIQRDAEGKPVTYAKGHPREGQPQILVGPEAHCTPERLSTLGVAMQALEGVAWHPLFRDVL